MFHPHPCVYGMNVSCNGILLLYAGDIISFRSLKFEMYLPVVFDCLLFYANYNIGSDLEVNYSTLAQRARTRTREACDWVVLLWIQDSKTEVNLSCFVLLCYSKIIFK